MRETAYAKINLALHVRSREPDGYHRIETLFAFCEDGDELEVGPADTLDLRVEGPMSEELSGEADNLVLRAARLLQGEQGASLRLTKCLPVAAGLGGGSADAAAALRLLNGFWTRGFGPEHLMRLAALLGADVPACVASVTARGKGRGDRLRRVETGLSGTPVLLVNPRKALSTARIFRGWDGIDRGPLSGDWMAGRNDLEPIALAMAPEIGAVLEHLRAQSGVRVARMSGSGATCFALFDSDAERDAAKSAVAAERPSWWHLATRLR